MADKEDSVGKKVLMAGLKGVAKGIDRPVAEANAFLNKKWLCPAWQDQGKDGLRWFLNLQR